MLVPPPVNVTTPVVVEEPAVVGHLEHLADTHFGIPDIVASDAQARAELGLPPQPGVGR